MTFEEVGHIFWTVDQFYWDSAQPAPFLVFRLDSRTVTRRLPAGQRRAQLLQSALEIAEEQGLGAVTVRGVAERAGVSLGVVHYCFEDKEELIGEVISAVNSDIAAAAEAFNNIDFGSDQTGKEGLRLRLAEAIDLVWAVVSASPDRQLLTYEIISYSLRTHGLPESGLATRQYDSYESIVHNVLERSSAASRVRWDVEIAELSRMVLCLIDGVALRWQVDRDNDKAVTNINHAVEFLVHLGRATD